MTSKTRTEAVKCILAFPRGAMGCVIPWALDFIATPLIWNGDIDERKDGDLFYCTHPLTGEQITIDDASGCLVIANGDHPIDWVSRAWVEFATEYPELI